MKIADVEIIITEDDIEKNEKIFELLNLNINVNEIWMNIVTTEDYWIKKFSENPMEARAEFDDVVEGRKKEKAKLKLADLEVHERDFVIEGKLVGNKADYVFVGGLTAVDFQMSNYWNALGEDDETRRKHFIGDAVPMLRWISTVGTPDWNAWRQQGKKGPPPLHDTKHTLHYLEAANELNKGFWDRMGEPRLLFELMVRSGVGEKCNHGWIKNKTGIKLKGLMEFISKLNPNCNELERNIIADSMTEKYLQEALDEFGYSSKDKTSIIKEYRERNKQK